MLGYPQFSFWILIALAQSAFSTLSNFVFNSVGKLLKNPDISGQTRDVQNICTVTKAGLLTGCAGWGPHNLANPHNIAQFPKPCKIPHNTERLA